MTNHRSAAAGESSSRSLVKAISWRVVAFIVLSIITYAFTGSLRETGMIALVYNVLQIGIYYLHERTWDRIEWGKPNGIDRLPPLADLSPEEQVTITEHLRELGYIE